MKKKYIQAVVGILIGAFLVWILFRKTNWSEVGKAISEIHWGWVAIAHIPLWIFHGALDGAVNPALSRNMVEALTNAGAHPGYTQYPEAGHFSWIAAYSDPMMINWLYSQRK